MAEVFLAIAKGEEGFEKPVVIKRLLPQKAAKPRFLQMFFDEARILLSLQHGNIVQILDMGKMDGLPFLTLEYVDGMDLCTILERCEALKSPLPHGLAAYIASEVCRGLDYAHRKKDDQGRPLNIVHRDISPSNIFISYEGAVKVGDFGLAKARDNLDKSETGVIKGKFSYLSPEQARGHALDQRSDIFSLGTTLYEMACGVRPFVGETDVQTILKVRETTYRAPSQVIPAFSPELEVVIACAMHAEAAKRYSTAAEMQDDLSRYSQQLPPMGDRQLASFMETLTTKPRRSQSFLIRLPETAALPTMTSVSHKAGISEYAESKANIDPTTRIDEQHRAPLPPLAPSRRRVSPLIWGVFILTPLLIATGLGLNHLLNPPTASLSIRSIPPGARVTINGKNTGLHTPAVLHKLPVNQAFFITLQHPQTEEASQRFQLQEGRIYTHDFSLQPLLEELSVKSIPPGCEVSLDGKEQGQTPLVLKLQRGKRFSLTLQKEHFQQRAITHRAEETNASLLITLEPQAKKRPSGKRSGGRGYLEVTTRKVANVYINGRWRGRTPNFRVRLRPGIYRVKVKPRGSNIIHRARVKIARGRTQQLRLTPPNK